MVVVINFWNEYRIRSNLFSSENQNLNRTKQKNGTKVEKSWMGSFLIIQERFQSYTKTKTYLISKYNSVLFSITNFAKLDEHEKYPKQKYNHWIGLLIISH